mmetsp:Transcript_120102/g.375537  ORF Transcript_120102/g.375537 Transcript_120102/m.375537 type:complete len:102 (-) Transcript_120102:182-487(-)
MCCQHTSTASGKTAPTSQPFSGPQFSVGHFQGIEVRHGSPLPQTPPRRAQPFLRIAATASDISSRFFLPRLCVPSLFLANFNARLNVEAEPIFSSSIIRRS